MGKFTTIVLMLYVIYYTANIIYDLFIKKEKADKGNVELEEFSLKEFSENNSHEPTSVQIDDVENLRISANNEEYLLVTEENEAPEENEMRRKFEKEEEIEKWNGSSIDEEKEKRKRKLEEIKQMNKKHFKDLMKKAETSIQVIGKIEGRNIYHSTI